MTHVYDMSLFVVRSASVAFTRMCDGSHTHDDLVAYRAWIVWRRLTEGEDADFIDRVSAFADKAEASLDKR